jgi:hypothetical protein
LGFLTRFLDRKISDRIIEGYRAEEVLQLLSGIENVKTFQYYYYFPGSKYPSESERIMNQSIEATVSFLNLHFTESLSLHVEIHHKTYKSGKCEIIFRGKDPKGEIVKLGVVEFKRIPNEVMVRKG